MTGSSTKRRGLGVLISAVAFGAYLVLTAVPAQAATCIYDAVNKEVNITGTGAGDDVTVRVGIGGTIEFEDVLPTIAFTQCGVATVNNTDGINIDMTIGDAAVIDLRGGPFAPGETPEASGTSEIEIDVIGSGSDIAVFGSDGDDTIIWGDAGLATAGVGAINLNTDSDADVTFTGGDDSSAFGDAGNDVIDLSGGAGTGSDASFVSVPFVDGQAGGDTLTGSDVGIDSLQGGDGDDTLRGLAGNDTLDDNGTIGLGDADGDGTVEGCGEDDERDVLEGGAGVDFMSAGDGRDTLRGGQGNDSEFGEDCSDVLDEEDGPNGADLLNGGVAESGGPAGCQALDDVVDYSDRNSDVTGTIGVGADDGEFGELDDIRGWVESVLGGDGDDTLTGDGDDNFLAGGPGDDTISSGLGDDCLQPGGGNDAMDGGDPTSSDMADFSNSPAGVTVDLDAGTATGDGNDTEVNVEDVLGSAFNDIINGDQAAGGNLILGGDGNDTIDAEGGNDVVDGGGGDDTITDSGITASEGDSIEGGAGNDTIDAGIGSDSAFGDDAGDATTPDGNDTVEGGEGNDLVAGEGGDDVVTDSGSTNGNNDDQLFGGDGNDILTSDEGIDFFEGDVGDPQGDGNDVITSGADDDAAFGHGGNDTFTDTGADDGGALDSDDEFFGGGNDDTGHLGQGDDLGLGDNCLVKMMSTGSAPALIIIDADPGDDDLFGEDGDDALLGCDGEDLIEGGNGDDEIDGDDDTDQLRGGEGEDDIFGDTGNDNVSGGGGDDDMFGGSGADTLSFKQSPAGVEADNLLGFAVGEGNDVIGSFEIIVGSPFDDILTGGGGTASTNFRLKGGAGTDILTGSGSNDTLAGAKGDDVLRGGGGDDTMKGGKGNDEGFGGRGTDLCSSVETPHSCEIFA